MADAIVVFNNGSLQISSGGDAGTGPAARVLIHTYMRTQDSKRECVRVVPSPEILGAHLRDLGRHRPALVQVDEVRLCFACLKSCCA